MPIVPVVDQNTTGAPNVAAPSVAPMRNYAPQQIEQAGATMQHVGTEEMRTGQYVQLRIQEQMDDANVKAAENKFIQSATDILHGDKGYMNTRGADSINAYDGASQALAKAKNDALEGLGNDVQKMMFNRVSQQHLVTFGAQMSQHRAQERIEYSAGQSIARADSMRAMAQNADVGSDDQNKYVETGVQEVLNAHSFRGIPKDSEQAQKAVRAFRSQITADNVSRLMEDGKFEDAQSYLSDQMKQGYVEGDTGDRLRRAIRGNLLRTEAIKQADDILAPYQNKELRATDLESMLTEANKIQNPEQREHVQDLVRAKFNEKHTNQQQQYRDNLNDVVNIKAQYGSNFLKHVSPDQWAQLDASDKADLTKPPAQENNLDTLYGFITNPDTLTVDAVKAAYNKGQLNKSSFLSLTERAMTLQSKPEYVQEASDLNGRIDYFADKAGINVFGMVNGSKAAQTPQDKANHAALTMSVNNEIDRVKAQNHGKITSDQVDQIIKKQLIQRTFTQKGFLWDTKTTKYGFQIPAGAAGVGKGSDGKMHYVDARGNDLGLAE